MTGMGALCGPAFWVRGAFINVAGQKSLMEEGICFSETVTHLSVHSCIQW